jgi:hypothetical protein
MAQKLLPQSKITLVAGLMGFALGLRHLLWPSRYDTPFDHYFNLLWFVYGASFVYRAYQPTDHKSPDA